MATVAIRPGVDGDHAFVINSFARDYTKTSDGRMMGEPLARKTIAMLLASPNWSLSIAGPLEGGDTIYGWILHDGHAIAWAHVKVAYRGHGFLRALTGHITPGSVDMPFWPGDESAKLALRNGLVLRHRPYLLLAEALHGK